MPAIIGWDIGGANVKAARIVVRTDIVRVEDRGQPLEDRLSALRTLTVRASFEPRLAEPPARLRHDQSTTDSRLLDAPAPIVVERAFALWREPHRLSAVLAEIAATLGGADAMAVTMTAELADCFATKHEGVRFVVDAVRAAFPQVPLWIYGVDGRFRTPDAARRETDVVAAANWMATATLVAETTADALLIDVGSTTTDIVPIVDARVAAVGRTDTERLGAGELVYTGLLRTPVCAIVRTVPLRGGPCRVAAEWFAIAADVHLWLEHITESDYTCDTPDGRGRSRSEAAARIARMVCADLETLNDADITEIATHVAAEQERQIAAGLRQVLRRLGTHAPRVAVLAGHGVSLAEAAAERAGLETQTMNIGATAARAAPAAAITYLLATSEALAIRDHVT